MNNFNRCLVLHSEIALNCSYGDRLCLHLALANVLSINNVIHILVILRMTAQKCIGSMVKLLIGTNLHGDLVAHFVWK